MTSIVWIKSRMRAKASEEIGRMANDPSVGTELALALARLKETMDKNDRKNRNA